MATSATLATATGLIELNPNPRPPARVVNETIPENVKAAIGVLRRPAGASDRSEEAKLAGQQVGSPYVVAAGSIRALDPTPRGESAYAMYVRMDPDVVPPEMAQQPGDDRIEGVYVAFQGRYGGVGEDGPYPLEDIKRGTALGVKEVPKRRPEAELLHSSATAKLRFGRCVTGLLPDGVSQVELTFASGSAERHPVRDNVLLAHLGCGSASEFPATVKWLSATGETLRTVRF